MVINALNSGAKTFMADLEGGSSFPEAKTEADVRFYVTYLVQRLERPKEPARCYQVRTSHSFNDYG